MFGYIKPQKSELLVREFDEYGGVYCALCRRIGREYGFAARLALNYDCTFYALVLMAVSGEKCPRFAKGRCAVNPLKRCLFCSGGEEELSAASALTMILAYYKALDDVADSGFFRSFCARAASLFFARKRRRAAGRYPELDRAAAKMAEEQRAVEAGDFKGVDLCAEPTANMVRRLLELSCTEKPAPPGLREVLREAGYHLGRWIYLMDAADDIPKDLKRRSFNPFVKKFHLTANSPREELDKARADANSALNATLCRLYAAADLMRFGCFGSIVRNIVFLGLPLMQEERLFRKEDGNV